MKRWVAFAGPIIFLTSCAWIYLTMVDVNERESVHTKSPVAALLHKDIDSISKEFAAIAEQSKAIDQQLNEAIAKNPKLGKVVQKRAEHAAEAQHASETLAPAEIPHDSSKPMDETRQHRSPPPADAPLNFISPVLSSDVCLATNAPPSKTDITMANFLDKEDFSDVDGGVWKQGFDISYSMSDFSSDKLHVFVVPHSHNDPGWLKTVEGYFEAQTRSILNNVVNFLSDNSARKFIWAEMSYLSMWWVEQGEDMKNKFRRLVKNKQLEIVTGGWVMNDEANTHYFAMIDQMIEGHEWIKNNVGENIIPSSGWAIDPFGHSPTMAYILKRMKFDFMLIQRTHYIVKKQFARQKSLEFKWRQTWDSTDTTDMLTHMMPFYSYDVPHTCGPDPKVCCQFDFRRLPGGRVTCPWRVNPVPIGPENVAQRAEVLLDQYRKKAKLFRTNVLLIPLGDDFRYDLALDAQNQFSNYEALMKYINASPGLNAKVEFGTLSDYYAELVKRAGKDSHGLPKDFPSVGGDFFTYTDRNDDYWSGYFTSRPFYKNLDRVLESVLRAAETLFTVSHQATAVTSQSQTTLDNQKAFAELTNARRMLGLFQHHDGITGTARVDVVADYGRKLITAYNGLMGMMQHAVAAFLEAKAAVKVTLSQTSSRPVHDALDTLTVIDMSTAPRLVTVYNPLAKRRTSIVRLLVSSRKVEVFDADNRPVPYQVCLSWKSASEADKDQYVVLIKVDTLPLGVTSLILRTAPGPAVLARTVVFRSTGSADDDRSVVSSDGAPFSFENDQYELSFDSNGMLQSVFSKSSKTKTDLKIQFLAYMSIIRQGHKPGAYLFFPAGQAEAHAAGSSPVVRITRGLLCNEVDVYWPQIHHTLRLYNLKGLEGCGIDIENIVDISEHNHKEFIMRMETGVKPAQAEFYSDLNGFTMQRRKYLSKLPLQGNFYPLPAMAFLEDSSHRLSVASGQPLGSASLKPGWLEIVLDRRMMQDDDRGLGQPVTDNKVTKSVFRLVLEKKADSSPPPSSSSAFPTLLAHLSAELLMHSPVKFVSEAAYSGSHVPGPLSGIGSKLACNLFMANLRMLQDSGSNGPGKTCALLLHNKGYDCRFSIPDFCLATSSKVELSSLLDGLNVKSADNVSLSLAHQLNTISMTSPIDIRPMEIEALKLQL